MALRGAGDRLENGAVVTFREGVTCLHRTPEDGAEVVTQARLGDTARLLERQTSEGRGWARLVLAHDGYSGWAREDAVTPGSWPVPGAPWVSVCQLLANVYAAPRVQAPLLVTAPLGAPLPLLGEGEDGWWLVGLPGGRQGFLQAGDGCRNAAAWAWQTLPELRRGLVQTARRLLGLPYRWGGTTPWGLDCSGLVQLVYRLHGFLLPRDACDQAKDERTVPVSREDLQAGDLLFFANHGHVGLAVSNWEFIHATTHGAPVVQVSEVDDAHWTARRDEIRRFSIPPVG